MFVAELEDGGVEDGSHKYVASAMGCYTGSFEAFGFGIGYHFEKGGLAALFHSGIEGLHLVEGKRMLLESPIVCFGMNTLFEDFGSIGYCEIIVCKHYD